MTLPTTTKSMVDYLVAVRSGNMSGRGSVLLEKDTDIAYVYGWVGIYGVVRLL